MTLACVGLGSNVDPAENLRRGLRRLGEAHRVVAVSPVYRSDAHGMEGPPFLNAVAVLETDLDAAALRASLKALEAACGRPSDHDAWAPRTLDADLLLLGEEVDPDVLACPWVLVPLVDVAPDAIHPTERVPLRALLAARPDFPSRLTREVDIGDVSPDRLD